MISGTRRQIDRLVLRLRSHPLPHLPQPLVEGVVQVRQRRPAPKIIPHRAHQPQSKHHYNHNNPRHLPPSSLSSLVSLVFFLSLPRDPIQRQRNQQRRRRSRAQHAMKVGRVLADHAGKEQACQPDQQHRVDRPPEPPQRHTNADPEGYSQPQTQRRRARQVAPRVEVADTLHRQEHLDAGQRVLPDTGRGRFLAGNGDLAGPQQQQIGVAQKEERQRQDQQPGHGSGEEQAGEA